MTEEADRSRWTGEALQHQRDMNSNVMEEMRARQGPLDIAVKAGSNMLILHTTGAKTGEPRVVPLGCTMVDDDLVIIASFQGAPRHPGWYHNLVAHPDVSIEIGPEHRDVRARVLSGAERARVFDVVKGRFSGFGDYEQTAAQFDREIPVVVLDPR